MNRALPGWAIDMIRDGVPAGHLAKQGDKAIWKALYQLSLSANQRGWDAMELRALIEEPTSQLGHQILTKDGTRPRTTKATTALFANTWDKAHEWLSTREGPLDGDGLRDEAVRRAKLIAQIVGDADLNLLDSDRTVLTYAADQAVERGMLRVALPWRAIADATGLGQRSVQSALERLVRAHLLVLAVPGRRAEPGKSVRRAALYSVLPTGEQHPYLCPGTGPMGPPEGPPAKTYGTPPEQVAGTPQPRPMGPPAELIDLTEKEAVDRTVTITAKSPEEMVKLLELIRESGLDAIQQRPTLSVIEGGRR